MNINAKFINVLKAILANPDEIQDVVRDGDEYYFKFRKQFLSVNFRQRTEQSFGNYSVFVYPRWQGPVENLKAVGSQPDEVELVPFHEGQFEAGNEQNLFEQLYRVVQSKHLNIDKVFDAILGGSQER
jgi:hypothetical protein